ncbi:MAG TPA: carboxypeptidase-like regulatory domain-containing protein [Terriglobales bacterium]
MAPLLRASRPVSLLTFIFSLCIFLLSSFPVSAAGPKPEKPYALIKGTVWDPDKRPAYGIKINIRRESDKKAKWKLTSDRRGEFAQRVPAGRQDYVVWADVKGVKTADGKPLHAEEVQVHIDNDERTDIGVHLTE